MDDVIYPELKEEDIEIKEEDAQSFTIADSSLDPLQQTPGIGKGREIPGEIEIDPFMHEVKEESEIKVEEEEVPPTVFTDDPLATCHQEPSWKEGKSGAREIPGEIKINQFIHEVKENEIKVEEEEMPPTVFIDDPLASHQQEQEPSWKEGKSEARAKEELAANKPEVMKIVGFGDSKTQEGITPKIIKVDTSKQSRVFMLIPVRRGDGSKTTVAVKLPSSMPNVQSGASQQCNQKEDAANSVQQDTSRKQALSHKVCISTKRGNVAASTSTLQTEPNASQKGSQEEDAANSVQDTIRKQALSHKVCISTKRGNVAASTSTIQTEPNASQKGSQEEDDANSVPQDTSKEHALTRKTRSSTKRENVAASTSTVQTEPKQKHRRTTSSVDENFEKIMALEMEQHKLRMEILRRKEKLINMEMEMHKKMIEASEVHTGALSAMPAALQSFSYLGTLSSLLFD